MIVNGFVHQLPDSDPAETGEWLDGLDAVVDVHGRARARFLIACLMERANQLQVGAPAGVTTPYVNTIPVDQQAWFPGDEHIERRIRAYVRWNTAAMVVRANKRSPGIGGHLATFASSAALYEVGFNHFFRGSDDGLAGDQVYFQGHASPGIYARAYLEGRLSEAQLERFRGEVGGGGLSSYPHPRCPSSGTSRRCRWDSVRSRRSTRPGSTATSPTATSRTRPGHGCGASSATASATSRNRSARCR